MGGHNDYYHMKNYTQLCTTEGKSHKDLKIDGRNKSLLDRIVEYSQLW